MTELQKILGFLKRLASNNNREWFNAHKQEWREADTLCNSLTRRLLDGLAKTEPDCRRLNVADCRYRIYRDTRFSPDKTPYKTHIGIYINPPGGKKSLRGGYYLHLEPGNCLVGAGVWCPEGKLLRMIRQSIFDETDEYLSIINNPEFRKTFTVIGEDLLKTAPKDFPKDWEHIDLIRPRSYTALAPLEPFEGDDAEFAVRTLAVMKRAKPFNDFLNYTVDEYEHPDPDEDLSHILKRL